MSELDKLLDEFAKAYGNTSEYWNEVAGRMAIHDYVSELLATSDSRISELEERCEDLSSELCDAQDECDQLEKSNDDLLKRAEGAEQSWRESRAYATEVSEANFVVHEELVKATKRAEKAELALEKVAEAAIDAGWDGVNNSKILHVFVTDLAKRAESAELGKYLAGVARDASQKHGAERWNETVQVVHGAWETISDLLDQCERLRVMLRAEAWHRWNAVYTGSVYGERCEAAERERDELRAKLEARDVCWHCKDCLMPELPRCEHCPEEPGACDIEDCDAEGCCEHSAKGVR
jgi:hypothetical protein